MRALALLLLLAATPAAATRVTDLRVDGPFVTATLDGPVETVKALSLDAPRRLVVDLSGVDAARRSAKGSGDITAARIGPFDAATARLVIDLKVPMTLAAAAVDGSALTLRLTPADAAAFARAVARGRRPVPTTARLIADFDTGDEVFAGDQGDVAPPPAAPRRHGARPLVVLDPGHGGKDAGTISPYAGGASTTGAGGYEKNVVLAIARAAAAELRKDGQVRVKLTRDDDTFIELNERVAIARREKADLLVSVHADSAPNPSARGASVYTLSETASDAVAARLAARENAGGGVPGIDTSAAPDVGDVLIGMTQRETMNVSVGFAETLAKSMAQAIGFRGEFHHFAGFLVLKAADVPAVLIETGYLSNPDDAALLQSDDGEKRIGRAIAHAIEAHFAR
ncbi:MAG: N-acetylmuramoyl-L-alanine amidase [Sphingomonadaceae bacterium]|nr:N-acetylmuramoyl-L-alanine amidase [Sphingomonadaceae bacterium]